MLIACKVSSPYFTIIKYAVHKIWSWWPAVTLIKPTCQNTQLFTWHLPLCSKPWLHLWRTSYFRWPNYCSLQSLLLPHSSTACTIATSIVHSKLDYCNSLYYKLPKSQLSRLQLIQNSLARTVIKAPKSCHITPILRPLRTQQCNYDLTSSLSISTFRMHCICVCLSWICTAVVLLFYCITTSL